MQIINSVGEEINNEEIWNEITSPYIKDEMLKSINSLVNSNDSWINSLKMMLEKKIV